MKNLSITILIVLISGSLYAQNDLENQFYIRLGYSLPTWSSYGFEGKDGWPANTHRTGGVFEMGSIYMINRLALADGLRLGINIDWLDINYHGFTYGDYVIVDVGFLSKIGPSVSYSPVDKLVFDAYTKIVVSWVSGVGMTFNGQDLEEDNTYTGTGGLKYTFGVNARYTKLILGFAYNGGGVKLTNPNGDVPGNNIRNSQTPLTSMNFTIGVSF